MEILDNEKMIKVSGGAFSFNTTLGIIGGAIVFLIGVLDGYIHPKKC